MRRRIIIIGILGLAGVAVFLRYQMVTKAPRPVIIFVMVRDSSSRASIEHAQVRLTGTGSTVTSLTTSDGSTILRSVLAPHWERSARVTIAADHYKYWEQSLNSLAPQLIGNVSGAGDNQKEIEANILTGTSGGCYSSGQWAILKISLPLLWRIKPRKCGME